MAPDTQWRLLIALWRLAELRKMEVFNLTWGDVLWNKGKLRVRSTKTQHIEGCELRYVVVPEKAANEYCTIIFGSGADMFCVR